MKIVLRSSFFVLRLLLLSTIYYLLSIYNAEAAVAVSSEELFKEAEKYDGKTVIYKGEVIGDIMIRQDFAWVNVQDGTGAIGVFCPQGMVDQIQYKGSYRFKGDIISVQGVFHRSCPEHGGDTDIHAEKIIVVKSGQPLTYPLDPQKIKLSIVLPAMAFILAIIHLAIRRFR